jgi:HNH endonuclease
MPVNKVHGPYRRRDGRQIVIVIEDDENDLSAPPKRRTISYPKWLLELQLGRKLDPDLETVDHIDSNFENNSLDNLRIMPRNEHSTEDTRRVRPVKFNCAWCKNEFERSPRLVRDKARKNKAGPFCSRKCAGQYSRKLQLKLIDKFDVQPVIDSEYYKKKYVKAFGSLISSDDLIDYLCDIWE